VAVVALFAAMVVVLSIRWWLPIDEEVYLWLQFHRTCALDVWARWVDLAVRAGLVAVILAALVRVDWWRPRQIAGLVALFLVGAGAVELVKTATERLRPNATPTTMTGNSFPSGHTTGATMAAVIAIVLVRGRKWPPLARWSAYAIAVACVVLQAAGRLFNGSHWLSDVVASVLFGVAWVLGVGSLRRLPRVAVGAGLAVAIAAFAVFDDLPGVRIRLPSALDESRASIAAVEFGTLDSRAALVGAWGDGPAEPIGPVAWARSTDVSVRLRTEAPQDRAILKLTLRPQAAPNRRGCARLLVSVNDWVAPEITLVRGWREYHLEPPAGVIRAGDNTVRFRIAAESVMPGDDAARGIAAFRYLRLFPGARGSGLRAPAASSRG
jgi:membrane-associated phospholipid phosphatase